MQHPGDVVAQLAEDRAEVTTLDELTALTKKQEVVLPVLDMAALAMRSIRPDFAKQLKSVTRNRREAAPTVLPPAKGELSGEEIVDLVAKMAKEFLFGKKESSKEETEDGDDTNNKETATAQAGAETTPEATTESKEKKNPRSSELYKAFAAKYELQTTSEDRDQLIEELNLIAKETDNPAIMTLLTDIESKQIRSMADLLEDLAKIQQEIRDRGGEAPAEAAPDTEPEPAPEEQEAAPDAEEEAAEEEAAEEDT